MSIQRAFPLYTVETCTPFNLPHSPIKNMWAIDEGPLSPDREMFPVSRVTIRIYYNLINVLNHFITYFTGLYLFLFFSCIFSTFFLLMFTLYVSVYQNYMNMDE